MQNKFRHENVRYYHKRILMLHNHNRFRLYKMNSKSCFYRHRESAHIYSILTNTKLMRSTLSYVKSFNTPS